MEVTNIIELFDLSEFDDFSIRPFLFDEIVEGKKMVFDFSPIILIRYGRSTKLVLFRQFCRDLCLNGTNRLSFVLKLIELVVEPLLGHQMGMGSNLPYAPLMHDDDPICPLDSGKSVGDDDGRSTFHEVSQGILDEPLRLRINVGGSRVEDQDGGAYG